MLSPPRPRGPGAGDLPDLLDQCVSLGEELGEVLEQWDHRVVAIVPGDLCLDHRTGDQAFLQALPSHRGLVT
jgi:hypothetical protein